LFSSGARQKSRSSSISKDDRHHLSKNLDADFIDADMLPKTRDVAIMATAAYIAANAPNDNEHMGKLHTWGSCTRSRWKAYEYFKRVEKTTQHAS
jgi:hypothetical protein